MEDQIEQILKDKILSAVESPLPELTRRDAELPKISNKAIVARKTSESDCRKADRMSESRPWGRSAVLDINIFMISCVYENHH